MTIHKAPYITILFLNDKGERLKQHPVVFKTGTQVIPLITDEKGVCLLESGEFSDHQKIKLIVLSQKQSKAIASSHSTLHRAYQDTIEYSVEEIFYTVILKKKRPFFLLWFLLIPIALMIPFQAHYQVKVETNQGLVRAHIPVSLSYKAHYFLREWHLFDSKPILQTQNTDSSGVAVFSNLPFSLYSYLFYYKTGVLLSTSEINDTACYHQAQVMLRFHKDLPQRYVTIKQNLALDSLTFYVVEADSHRVLPGSKLVLHYTFEGALVEDSVISDASGKALFPSVPRCAQVTRVVATYLSYQGEANYEASTEALKSTTQEHRQIPIETKASTLIFHVQDAYTHQRVKAVDVQVILDGKQLLKPRFAYDGTFSITAKATQRVSIIISKLGYIPNKDQIVNKRVGALKKGRHANMLYLKLPPCNPYTRTFSSQRAGDSDSVEYDMKQKKGVFYFEFNTQIKPDCIKIYDGRKKDCSPQTLIYEFPMGGTHGWRSKRIHFSHHTITIVGRAESSGSVFDYIVNCPE